MRYLELLSPARTADIGIEAIRHGADAVYIGASSYGARQSAGNSVEDISRLVAFAHQFDAKVYVTVNTIIYDDELQDVERLIHELYDIGVDALIVQDMAIARLNIPPIPLHASTQMDNRSVEKVEFLSQKGYEQVVLARELTIDEIQKIHERCPVTKLEVFVHGALCVSLSGRCYASEALMDRSANRGECAQVCRMSFDLEDEKGNVLVREKNLLSLKDMCRIDCLEDLAAAGATSFKIEGRLKDMDYVKNVTAAYSEALNRLIEKYPDRYERSSRGTVRYKFTPDVEKSFNRGFTNYFLYGENDGVFSVDTPKSIGKQVGRIREVYTDSFIVDAGKDKDVVFSNGDGVCFFSPNGKLIGMRVNRVDGKRLYPYKMSNQLRRGIKIYRNHDKHFVDSLHGDSATRHIPVSMTLSYNTDGFLLTLSDGNNAIAERFAFDAELARSPQRENIFKQLSKLGNTPLMLEKLDIEYKENFFIPSSILSFWRRRIVDSYLQYVESDIKSKRKEFKDFSSAPAIEQTCAEMTRDQSIFETANNTYSSSTIGFQFNVSNKISRDFYMSEGFKDVVPAYELKAQNRVPLMTCRHCIKFALGMCVKRQNVGNPTAVPKELYLRMQNGKRLRLEFDCKNCLMKTYLN